MTRTACLGCAYCGVRQSENIASARYLSVVDD